MKIELYHTTCELKTRFRNEKDPRLAARIRAVYLRLMEKTAPDIATLLGYSRRAIQTWIQAYNQNGIEGLQDRPGRGITCRLNPDQLQWLRQRMDEGPPGPDEGISVFHGRDIQRMIRQQFGVKYRLSAIYTLLKRLGCSYVSSRLDHPKSHLFNGIGITHYKYCSYTQNRGLKIRVSSVHHLCSICRFLTILC